VRVGALIPVKPLDKALMRLAGLFDAPVRRDLQAAMLTDILACCSCVPEIERTVVVTSDPQATEIARAHGVEVVADHTPARGINAAVARGLEVLDQPALVLMADLAGARPSDLEFVLANALEAPGATLVRSLDGTGTNVMLLNPPGVIEPHLGPGSLRRHLDHAERLGVAVRVLDRPALSLDVDTPTDLAIFMRAPVDGATRRVLTSEVVAQALAAAAT
jgi:2-phospho-L-lactate/phosphoenolpyruvate guanylyltransferase